METVLKTFLMLGMFLCAREGLALDCYTYSLNSYEETPKGMEVPLISCQDNYTHCATLAWTTNLSKAGKVEFQQGLCTNWSVCQTFCSVLQLDPTLKEYAPQCQQQCCNTEGCNTPKKLEY